VDDSLNGKVDYYPTGRGEHSLLVPEADLLSIFCPIQQATHYSTIVL
jgi:hypothetical protein